MIKVFWLILGFIFLTLGTIGVFLPILPTVPFYILTLFCFSRSSKRVNDWFLKTRIYKDYVDKIVNKKSISLKSKIITIVSFTFIFSIAFYFMRRTIFGRIVLFIIWFLHMIYFIFGIKVEK